MAIQTDFPLITRFCQLYWNQMGHSNYGTVANAFNEMLKTVEKHPDGGSDYKSALSDELSKLQQQFANLKCSNSDGDYLNFDHSYLFYDDVQILLRMSLNTITKT